MHLFILMDTAISNKNSKSNSSPKKWTIQQLYLHLFSIWQFIVTKNIKQQQKHPN